MYAELLAGESSDPKEFLKSVFREKCDEVVLLRDIPFYSVCEHHLMPFIGTAHVAYLPEESVLGVSSWRVLSIVSRIGCRYRNGSQGRLQIFSTII